MIQPRMTSSPARKLAFDSELVTLSRLLVRMITIGGRVNQKTPKMELQVSFLHLSFRNGMFFVLFCFIIKKKPCPSIFQLYIIVLQRKTCLVYSSLYQSNRIQISCQRILNPQHLVSSYLYIQIFVSCIRRERSRKKLSDQPPVSVTFCGPLAEPSTSICFFNPFRIEFFLMYYLLDPPQALITCIPLYHQ